MILQQKASFTGTRHLNLFPTGPGFSLIWLAHGTLHRTAVAGLDEVFPPKRLAKAAREQSDSLPDRRQGAKCLDAKGVRGIVHSFRSTYHPHHLDLLLEY